MRPIVDPRQGDVEDDASSTKRRSMLTLAGSLLVEISIPKLIAAWVFLLVIPGLLLGLAPLAATAWLAAVTRKIASPIVEILPLLIFIAVLAVGWFFGRRLFRLAESSFWSLNALAIEPGYAMCREALRHLAEGRLLENSRPEERERLRTIAAVVSGVLITGVALLAIMLAWPHTRWIGDVSDFLDPRHLIWVALANTVVLVGAYFAVAALIWAFADATMPHPRDVKTFPPRTPGTRAWRVAHLSDLHVVGERYGFRIESGRSGPRGNARLHRTLALLEELDASEPLDLVLISGDATDAGRAAEWAEFLDAMAAHPRFAERVLIIPGNHDVNIVDRANPARLDLNIGPNSRLRKIRTLSAIATLQGSRVRVIDRENARVGETLADALKRYAHQMATFAESARPFFSTPVGDVWAHVFPMVLPPDREDGLGILLLNSNSDSHFSFTNALGLIPTEHILGIEIATAQFPRASWLIVLHHHVVEYPRPAKVMSERIGTALVNSNVFVRSLRPKADRVILMHGHRHIDWIGTCGGITIVSAPSPVMEATDDFDTYFYIHTLEAAGDGRIRLLAPQRVTVRGEPSSHDPSAASAQQSPKHEERAVCHPSPRSRT